MNERDCTPWINQGCGSRPGSRSPGSALRSRRKTPPHGRTGRCASSCRSRPAARSISSRARSASVMSRSIGQQVVVENRTGAGGTIGMDMAIKSAPDGYTVLITNDNAASAPHIMKLGYDYTKEMVPVMPSRAPAADPGGASLARRQLGRRTGRLREGQSGDGLCDLGRRHQPARDRRMVQAEAGIKLDHVPYRGAGQAINDLIAAHVKIAFLGPTALVPHYRRRHAAPARAIVGERARRRCRKCRPWRTRATRAWCSKPGMRHSFRPARRRRSSRDQRRDDRRRSRTRSCSRPSPRARSSRSAAARKSSASSRRRIRRNMRGW